MIEKLPSNLRRFIRSVTVDFLNINCTRTALLWAILLSTEGFAQPALIQLIIDNDDSGTSFEGEWNLSRQGPTHGPSARVTPRDSGPSTFQFTFAVPRPGRYAIHFWWVSFEGSSTNVAVTVDHEGGQAIELVDQSQNAGRWNLLGDFLFRAAGTVTVTAPGGGITSVDALRAIRLHNAVPVPEILEITPNPATEGMPVSFIGSGTDPDGEITAYLWNTSRDEPLSSEAAFSTDSLSLGDHQISFRVRDSVFEWSSPVELELTVIPQNSPPTARILGVNTDSTAGDEVSFYGQGIDADGEIVDWLWQSDIDGEISMLEDFSTSSLSVGRHQISFSVQDDAFEWSEIVTAELEVHDRLDIEFVLKSPTDRGAAQPGAVGLEVEVIAQIAQPLEVTFQGRRAGSDEEFTVVALPDTQNYVERGLYPEIFTAQTQWIADNIVAHNIVFVTHEGDVVDHADSTLEWDFAIESMALLHDVVPYGIAAGNHDQDFHLPLPAGETGTLYPVFFANTRFLAFPWYGGSFPGGTNWNSFQLISVAGVDLLFLHLEFCPRPEAVAWADTVLKAHPHRQAIITTHGFMLEDGERDVRHCGSMQYLWDALVQPHDNVFFVLCGHEKTEGRRTDDIEGRKIHQVLANYQSEKRGGNGYLRLLRFVPKENRVDVSTFSPFLGEFRKGPKSEFCLEFPMRRFEVLGVSEDATGTATYTVDWRSVAAGRDYEWFVEVTDARGRRTKSPLWTFSTGPGKASAEIVDVSPNRVQRGSNVQFTGDANDPTGEIRTFLWESSIDGPLSNQRDFSADWLSIGRHTIYFSVEGDDGCWSEFDTTELIVSEGPPVTEERKFLRGDVNDDSTIDLSDGITVLDFLFSERTSLNCKDAADVNDTGSLDISDPINLFAFLFLGGDEPQPPGPRICGVDPTPETKQELGCESSTFCET